MFSLALILLACDEEASTFPTAEPGTNPTSGGEDLSGSRPESSAGEGEDDDGVSVVAGTTTARSAPPPSVGPDCSEDDGGTSLSGSPETYGIRLRALTLLGASGTDDHDLLTNADLADAEEAILTADLSELSGTLSRPPAGTYEGVSIELYTVRADIDLALTDDGAALPVRGWFVEDGDIQPRDITVELDGEEHWVAMTDLSTVPVTPEEGGGDTGLTVEIGLGDGSEEPPADRLTLWEDEDFWSADPIVLSSEDGGADYRMSLADGPVTLTDDGGISIALLFDIGAVLSWWEGGDLDGVFSLASDCGLRVGPPDISVSISQED